MVGTPVAQTLADFCIDKMIISATDDFVFNSNEYKCICGYKIYQEQPISYRILPLICCKDCKTISDFSRPYQYEIAPVRYQDVSEFLFPLLTLNFSPIVTMNPNWTQMETVSDKLLNSYFENFNSIPGMLKHFTTKEGACGIISSSELWAFSTSSMNDPSEIKHGQDVIRRVYDDFKSSLTDDVRVIFERAIRIVCDPTEQEKYFVVCFTTMHNSAYHWENYAQENKGIELGFSSNHLGLTGYQQIRKVIYDDSIKTQLVTQVFKEISDLYERLPKCCNGWDFDMNLASFAALTNDHLAEFIFTFKDVKWSAEDEYRLIIKNGNSVCPVDTLGEKKFVRTKLSQTSPNIPLLPIVGAFFGERTPEKDKIAVCRALIDEGYSHVSIKELS